MIESSISSILLFYSSKLFFLLHILYVFPLQQNESIEILFRLLLQKLLLIENHVNGYTVTYFSILSMSMASSYVGIKSMVISI